MNTQKMSDAVVIVLFLTGLSLLSRHPFDIAILLGSFYLLQIQTIEPNPYGCYGTALETVIVWRIGVLSYRLTCPVDILFLILLLTNTTVLLFSPITRKKTITGTEQIIKQHKTQKNKAVFVSGILSIFTIILYGKPVSTLISIALLLETGLMLGIILGDLLQERFKRF